MAKKYDSKSNYRLIECRKDIHEKIVKLAKDNDLKIRKVVNEALEAGLAVKNFN